jgi:hypothetical protein
MSGRNYTVYFEFFGKKMKHTLFASSQESAKQQIIDKITFDKIDVVAPDQPKKSSSILGDDFDADAFIDLITGLTKPKK